MSATINVATAASAHSAITAQKTDLEDAFPKIALRSVSKNILSTTTRSLPLRPRQERRRIHHYVPASGAALG